MAGCGKKSGGYSKMSYGGGTHDVEKQNGGGGCKSKSVGGKKTKSKRKTKGKKVRKTRRKTSKKSFLARLFKL